MKYDVYIAGIGGQGILTLARVLAYAAFKSGLNVIVAETRGLSQRGGSVGVYVRLGDVYAPVPSVSDLVIALEALEALRALSQTTPKEAVVNAKVVKPPTAKRIPQVPEVKEAICKTGVKAYFVRVKSRYENMYLLGASYALTALQRVVPLSAVEESIKDAVKNPLENLEAFKMGMAADNISLC